jgi:Recombination endonuclease VII
MRCKDCHEDKPEEEFPRNRNSASGRGSYCKPCHNLRTRASRARVGGARRYHLRYRYGITEDEIATMKALQDGRCAICRLREATQVDHDHASGKVRGILCLQCNAGLGALRDDPRLVYQAIDYLSETPLEDLCN